MSEQQDSAANAPLLQEEAPASPRKSPKKSASASVNETQVVITSVSPKERPLSVVSQSAAAAAAPVSPAPAAAPVTNEYRFVHQRIPIKKGNLKFLLPILLLVFQVLFIVLFGVFGDYNATQSLKNYPLFEDLHAITLLGFGFLMTFLKRYGYGSIGFTLLLVAFVVQWALIIRGWVDRIDNESAVSCAGSIRDCFKIDLHKYVFTYFFVFLRLKHSFVFTCNSNHF
jgi:hypothetical protein